MNKRYKTGNAQYIGTCGIQANYFSIIPNEAGDLLAVLADGTVDHMNGRRAAIMAVEICVHDFLQNKSGEYTSQFLFDTALKVNREVEDVFYIDKKPHLSLSIALFTNKKLHYFDMGNNRICIYNGHTELVLGSNTDNLFNLGEIELPSKTSVGIFSAGIYFVTNHMERKNIVGRIKLMDFKDKAFGKAQGIVNLVKLKGLTEQMNATALLVEVIR